MKKILLTLIMILLCGCSNTSHLVEVNINNDEYSYSDTMIVPIRDTIEVSISSDTFDGLVILTPVDNGKQFENYITGGISTKFEVEKGKMYKIGTNVKQLKKVVFKVKNVDLAIE